LPLLKFQPSYISERVYYVCFISESNECERRVLSLLSSCQLRQQMAAVYPKLCNLKIMISWIRCSDGERRVN